LRRLLRGGKIQKAVVGQGQLAYLADTESLSGERFVVHDGILIY
jgi:hypothetical protein